MKIIKVIIRICGTIALTYMLPQINETEMGQIFTEWQMGLVGMLLMVYMMIGILEDLEWKPQKYLEKEIKELEKATEIMDNKKKYKKEEIIEARGRILWGICEGIFLVIMLIYFLITIAK